MEEAPASPTVIFMHHPPFTTGIARMDEHGRANAAELADVVARHRQVQRIVCGHLHRSIQALVGSTRFAQRKRTINYGFEFAAEDVLQHLVKIAHCSHIGTEK